MAPTPTDSSIDSAAPATEKKKVDSGKPAGQGLAAMILVGGFGTRLRPLTLSLPKPLVPFANMPLILHQINALIKVGVDHVVLAVNYRAEVMQEEIDRHAKDLGIKISISVEDEPLGTGGPLKLAEHILNNGKPFFCINSDLVSDFCLDKLIEKHQQHDQEATIFITTTKEPAKYGVVLSDQNGRIKRFVEKPQVFIGNRINTGIYLFSPQVFKRLELKRISMEQDIFPIMAGEGKLYCLDLPGFWMDVGQPPDYLAGMELYLDSMRAKDDPALAKSGEDHTIIEPCLIHPSVVIEKGSIIGPYVIADKDVVIGKGTRIDRSAILEGSKIKRSAYVTNTIVGWRSTVGAWTRLEGVTVLGEDVNVRDELHLNGARVLPHKDIKECVSQPAIIM